MIACQGRKPDIYVAQGQPVLEHTLDLKEACLLFQGSDLCMCI